MLDIAVVGAGPAGARTAWLLARAGLKVALYEEHSIVGEPCQCAGLISPRVFEELGYQHTVLNSLGGARVHGPSGHFVSFHNPQPRGLVIDRPEFDRSIVEQATDAGVRLYTESRVQGCRWRNERVSYQIKTSDVSREEEARMLVGADGPTSRVARDFKILNTGEVLPALGTEISGWGHDEDSVFIFVGSSIAPNFFAWIIPSGHGKARIGIAIASGQGSVREYFKKFLQHSQVAKLLKGCQIAKPMGGIIPVGYNPQAFSDGVVLVGDAAGMAKPTSGGGIYTGLVSAGLAAKTIIEVLERGQPTAKALSRYQRRLNTNVGRELKKGSRLRKAFLRLSDDRLDELIRLLGDQEVLKIIEEYGDIDYSSRVVAAVLKKKPQLLKFAPLLLKPFV